MKNTFTTILFLCAITCMAQDMERFNHLKAEVLDGSPELAEKALAIVPGDTAILYAMSAYRLNEGGKRRSRKLLQQADSLSTVLIAQNDQNPKYFYVRGLARQRIADELFYESGFKTGQPEVIALYENALTDLNRSLELGLCCKMVGSRAMAEQAVGELAKSINKMKFE